MNINFQTNYQECPYCKQKINKQSYQQHQSLCQEQQNRMNNRNTQQTNFRNTINQPQRQQTNLPSYLNQPTNYSQQRPQEPQTIQSLPVPQSQQKPMEEEAADVAIICEYCQQNYPGCILNEHLQVCDARSFLLQCQEEEQQAPIRQQQQAISRPNRNRQNNRITINNGSQSEIMNFDNVQPGQTLHQETTMPDGTIRIIVAKRDLNGNLNTTITQRGGQGGNQIQQQSMINGFDDNIFAGQPQGLRRPQGLDIFNQGNSPFDIFRTEPFFNNGGGMQVMQQGQPFMQQGQRFPGINFNDRSNMIVIPGGMRGQGRNRLQTLAELQGLIQLLGQHSQQEDGLEDEELDNINQVQYKPSTGLSEENRKCVICMSDYEANEDLKLLPCTHRFHAQCIEQWLRDHSKCPICKKDVRQQ